ncbi:hypothetical protein [Streptomyces himalayensis]|uniref:Uncharacterized protein n=1 Tax=Streptomyces himalayensis subsp. himalayensis TaxID=2756131 RepID=A0A7W0DUH3_9ACTN|nr:hypothetical protein [Streptomyces himalayensis]MBA2951462.1 hypothetical protein [Streptomyces himalayensis subsp. himalayensis]
MLTLDRRNLIPWLTQDAKAGGSGSLPLAARVTERESVSIYIVILSSQRNSMIPKKTRTALAEKAGGMRSPCLLSGER